MMPNNGEKICLGEPAYEVGSLFRWSVGTAKATHSAFVLTDTSPVGFQDSDESPVVWEWQYQIHYLPYCKNNQT